MIMAATLNPNQIPSTTQSQTSLDQPSISRPTDTDRNLDLDLRQSGNTHKSRSPQRRPSFRSGTPSHREDRPTRIRSTSPLPPLSHISQAASTVMLPTAPTNDRTTLNQPSTSRPTDTDRNLDLDLRPKENRQSLSTDSNLSTKRDNQNYVERSSRHGETV